MTASNIFTLSSAGKASVLLSPLDCGPHFRQRVVDDRQIQAGDFLEPPPAACDERLSLAHVRWIEPAFVEFAFDFDWRKVVVDDELREHWITADVPLTERVERFGIDLADHIAQIELAVGDFRDISAADFAEIAL